jgi:MarR family transcriptional regulator, organic hydroperoxide resistance regulator
MIEMYMKTPKSSRRQAAIASLMQAIREEVRLSVLWGNAAAELAGIHPTDAMAVIFLNEAGEATAGQLAKVTGLTTGAMTAAIDRLESAGLVTRKVDPHDRRKVIVKAIKMPTQLSGLRKSVTKGLEDALSRYSDAELLRFVDFKNITNAFLKRGINIYDDKRVRSFIHTRSKP